MKLLISLCCLLLWHLSYAGHYEKFRKCDDTSFCRRQRNNNELPQLKISSLEKVSVTKNGFIGEFLGENNNIVLSITRVIDNIIRIEGKELNRNRYITIDVLIDENSRKSIEFDNVINNNNNNNAIFTWNNYKMIIEYGENFLIKILDSNDNIELLINSHSMLYFDTFDENLMSSIDYDSDENSLYSEKFSSHTYYYDKGPSGVGLDFTFYQSTNVFGIPEHGTQFSLKNTRNINNDNNYNGYDEPYRLWNLDVFEYELDIPASLYGSIPFIISHSKYNTNGVFWLNPSETYIDVWDDNSINNKNSKTIRWMSEYGILEAFVILGGSSNNNNNNKNKNNNNRVSNVLSLYSKLTGTQAMPPLFSLGHHQCRWNYNSIDDVVTVNNEFNNRNTPNDVIWLDIEHTDNKKYFTWDSYNFSPDRVLNDMIENVYNNGNRRMVTIVDPHIKKDESYYIYKEISDQDLWTKTRDNEDYLGWCWPADSRYPDYSNPKMVEYWIEQFSYDKYKESNNHLHIWNDMNEPSVFNGPEITMPKSNRHMNNVLHGEVHNLYGFWVQSSTFKGLLYRSDYNERPYLLSRSFFAGSQRYCSVWTGDNYANWEHLKISVPMLLSMSIAGLPFVGADVGGFFNNPDAELMTRWYELATYYPFFRNHAHQDTKRREFWLFDEIYSQRMRHSIINRYRILPYIYTLFYYSYLDLSPIMRPLFYEFNNDENIYNIDDAFMFGNIFYVKPIVESQQNSIKVLLPNDNENDGTTLWYDLRGSVKVYKGGNEYELTGYDSGVPVLRRGGTITPEKHRLRRSSDLMIYDPYTLIISLDNNGEANGYLYIDDRFSTKFEKNNEYYLLEFIFKNSTLTNNIIHSSNNLLLKYVEIDIERIIILSDNGLSNVESIEIISDKRKSSKPIISKDFGMGMNSLIIKLIPGENASKVNSQFEVKLVFN